VFERNVCFVLPSVCHGNGSWFIGMFGSELVGDASTVSCDHFVVLQVGVFGACVWASGSCHGRLGVSGMRAAKLSHETDAV
jgi:hypothetical protein